MGYVRQVLCVLVVTVTAAGCCCTWQQLFTVSKTAEIYSKDPRAREQYEYLFGMLKGHPVPEISGDLYRRVMDAKVLVLPDVDGHNDGFTGHIMVGRDTVPVIGFMREMLDPATRSAQSTHLQLAAIHEYVHLRQYDRDIAVFRGVLPMEEMVAELNRRREKYEREAYGATCLMARRLGLQDDRYASCQRGGTMSENYQYAAKYFKM